MTGLGKNRGWNPRIYGQQEEIGGAAAPNLARFMSGIAIGALALHAASAHAQDTVPTPTPSDQVASEEGDTEIVVTGTQLRGIAPVGTNVVSLSQENIAATGATSANDILTKVPQVTSAFGNTPMAPPGGLAIIRPNIRGLGASGTNTTLVIVDGHRVVGAGVVQSTPDPDVIPLGALERVDIVPDGGSSIYGSDAIGGVINYISRRKFDGLEISARTGFADDYQNTDVNVTAGKDWGSGSGYISYSWAHNNAIFGKDRDYVRQVTPNEGYCGAGTLFANGTSYAITGANPDNYTPGTISGPCDITDEASLWPRITRHNIIRSLTQDFGSSVTLDVRAYYADRQITHYKGLQANDSASTVTITAANPYFNSIAGETSQVIRTNYLGIYDDSYQNRLRSYGITPTLTVRFGDWQLRTMFNYGESKTETSETQINEDVATTTLNYYNLAANTQNQLAAASLHNFGVSNQTLLNARAIADGPLTHIGGGDVRMAIGVEYYRETIAFQTAQPTAFGAEQSVPVVRLDRNVKAVFGEIAVPLFGPDNAVPGIHALTLSASGRYDDYSDQGGTFNPKLGITYQPNDWIKIRGNWGKSFNAPSLVDMTGVTVAVPAGFAALGQTSPTSLILIGNRGADVKPQIANTWSVGLDLAPPAVPGLTMSATYWNVDMKREISLLAGQPITPATQGLLTDPVSCPAAVAQYSSYPILNLFPFPPALVCAIFFGGASNIAVLDWRVQNLGEIKTDGLDFNVSYDRKVSFGAVHASVAGSYTLDRDRSIVPGAPFVSSFDAGASRLSLVASLGAQVGDFSGSATLTHRGGYSINPGVPANPANPFPQAQNEIGSFTAARPKYGPLQREPVICRAIL
jgi:iron complex outermembrane receptor protein